MIQPSEPKPTDPLAIGTSFRQDLWQEIIKPQKSGFNPIAGQYSLADYLLMLGGPLSVPYTGVWAGHFVYRAFAKLDQPLETIPIFTCCFLPAPLAQNTAHAVALMTGTTLTIAAAWLVKRTMVVLGNRDPLLSNREPLKVPLDRER